jgi:hypothetical protein
MGESTPDDRTNNDLLTEWRKLEEIRRSLTRQGAITGDATPAQVMEALRKLIPPTLFSGEN